MHHDTHQQLQTVPEGELGPGHLAAIPSLPEVNPTHQGFLLVLLLILLPSLRPCSLLLSSRVLLLQYQVLVQQIWAAQITSTNVTKDRLPRQNQRIVTALHRGLTVSKVGEGQPVLTEEDIAGLGVEMTVLIRGQLLEVTPSLHHKTICRDEGC